MQFSTLKKYIEKCPFTYWLNGRWFLQIVERDSWHLYPLYPLFPCSDFVSQMWGWFGGGCNVFLTFFICFEKIIWEYKIIISHLMGGGGGGGGGYGFFFLDKTILSDFTFYAIFNIKFFYWKVPLHLLVKLEVVSPNSREGQLASISIISSIPLFWFCISNVGVVWGGGGV